MLWPTTTTQYTLCSIGTERSPPMPWAAKRSVSVGLCLAGMRVSDRRDGLSPAGWLQQVVLDDPQPLQDYGCSLPADPFAMPSTQGG